MGSYGPSSINEKTGKKIGINFPVITINDMVNAQFNLLEYFGIEKLFCVTGGSMGGMQVLQFVANYPDKSKIAVPIIKNIWRGIVLVKKITPFKKTGMFENP